MRAFIMSRRFIADSQSASPRTQKQLVSTIHSPDYGNEPVFAETENPGSAEVRFGVLHFQLSPSPNHKIGGLLTLKARSGSVGA